MERSAHSLVIKPLRSFLSLVLFLLAFVCLANAQQPGGVQTAERDRGIQFYKQNDFQSASQTLKLVVKKQKDDISAWHYLGLALEQLSKAGDARKAHEKAARLGDILLSDRLNQAYTGTAVAAAVTPIGGQLMEAAESADKYITLSKLSKSKSDEWNARAASLRAFAEIASGNEGFKIYSGKDVTTKARVLSKPEATYTERARRHMTSGTVVLRAIFAANGRVIGIRAVSGLPDGLTEQAIGAAQRIKFIPATKDGRPVSMYMQLEYNFNVY